MSSEHLVGTSIPRFTFDTPTKPGNDFYALCEGEQPLVMIFLPAFDHPVTREYLTHYLKTCARLRGVRLACVVHSSARTVAQATQGAEFPFPIICDAPGVLYSYLGVEQARGLRSWSFAAQRIYKTAKEQGYRYDSSAPQILPLTLVVGHLGKILFIHSGRSQTDLPEDCTAIREIAREVASTLAAGPEGALYLGATERLYRFTGDPPQLGALREGFGLPRRILPLGGQVLVADPVLEQALVLDAMLQKKPVTLYRGEVQDACITSSVPGNPSP